MTKTKDEKTLGDANNKPSFNSSKQIFKSQPSGNRSRVYQFLAAFVLGTCAALPFMFQLIGRNVLQGLLFWAVFGISTAMLAGAVYFLINHWALPRLKTYPTGWKVLWAGSVIFFGIWLSFNIPLVVPSLEFLALPSFLSKLLYKGSAGILLGLFLYILSLWLVTTPIIIPAAETTHRNWRVLKYTLPMIVIWLIYLLAYYPGMMSADSMNQWGQILSGNYVDHHPVFHTLSIWLLTRVYFSPIVIAIAQILALALVAGACFSFLETQGVSRFLLGIACMIFAIIPVNGTMVNTLWKDIPYSISVLGLTLLIAKIVFSNGKWVESNLSRTLLGITAALVLLFRHDGLPIGLGVLALLILAYPQRWKSWLIAIVIGAGMYFGVRGPLYQWVGVQKSTVLAESTLALYPMAAYTQPGRKRTRC